MAAAAARYAQPREAGAVVEIIRGAFEQRVIERTIYGCNGVERYVEATIRMGPSATPSFLVVADSGEILGAAEVAVIGGDLFLSYVATRPKMRSRGVGTRLLRTAVEHGQQWQARTMTLDVFADNLNARAWYAALGFTPLGERCWWEFELPESSEPALPVAGLAHAQLSQDAFGFSEISVVYGSETFRIGRLGSAWFRVTDPAAVAVPPLMAALRKADARRALLVLGGADDMEGRNLGVPALRSVRLQASLDGLGERLVKPRRS